MSIARMEDAQRSCQSQRGWNFPPEPARRPITFIDVLRVLFRPATLASMAILALCVFLIVRF